MDTVSAGVATTVDPKGVGYWECFPTLVGDDLCSEAPKPLGGEGLQKGTGGKQRNLLRMLSQVERHTKPQGTWPLTGAGSRLG
jgi:hypothetical protein